MTDDPKARPNRHDLGQVFNEVPELYDRVRPGYPDKLFGDLVTVTGVDERSSVLEVGCGTGQATRSLAALKCSVTAIEPGEEMAALARRRMATFGNVEVGTSTFEEWDDRGGRFDVLVAASSWHWVDPSIGWQRAHDVLYPGGWMALLGNVVFRRPGEPEVYAETADLHERFCPGNPGWGHPPLEDYVRTTDEGWGPVDDPGGLFGPTIGMRARRLGSAASAVVRGLRSDPSGSGITASRGVDEGNVRGRPHHRSGQLLELRRRPVLT
ncbi:class I SAM-dependent methyltransferase [Streptomyces sp. NPDC058316]|uniref:class I SAM-dependent methyltransferase n=1 Tax=unclassified Streptomyces TaxID=2593676 RepID=UPI0036E2C20F